MRKIFVWAVPAIILTLTLLPVSLSIAAGAMNNEDIVKLVKA